ncbi:MAG: molecular chaperone DnaJ [Actinomycetota bacterium]|nr:molecular chaperone DnaJ [Actinomycetota bacterium]
MNGSQAWLEKDFYKALGVGESATEAEIRRAYRKIAQKYHPDRNPGDKQAEERMKEAAEAYDVLSDAKKRADYDQIRRLGAQGGGFGFEGGPGFQGSVRFEDFGDLGGIFSQMFGGGRGRRRSAPRGEDREAEAHLSFDDAMQGATFAVALPGDAPCDRCGGSGAEPGTSVSACPVCKGQGIVEENQGLFSIPRTCSACGGRGRQIEKPCATCRGAGTVARTDQVRVRIPAGVKDGARIRVRGRGGSHGGAPGDLYVVVHVAPHPIFGRNGDDLTLSLPVLFTEAALGAEIKVPTLDAPVTLKLPAGTQNGRTFRVKGRGAPRVKGGGYGDLLATVNVVVPDKLTPAERESLEKFVELHAVNPREGLGV